MKKTAVLFLTAVLSCQLYCEGSSLLNIGPQVSYAGEDLLKGGPTLGPGVGLNLLRSSFGPIKRAQMKSGIQCFYPIDHSNIFCLPINISIDLCYRIFSIGFCSINPGAAFVYDYCRSDEYNINELSVAVLNRVLFTLDNSVIFIEGSLELGGFDTYIFSIGYLVSIDE